ncbi:MAG: response regulator transcription factor [Actinomycetota bacterium]|nr:response regulator transcription factor [Actinomycetota bacterium]
MSEQRILVVDDDADIRGLVRELLERRGFAVAEAADGKQALQAFYEGRPDLVVLDVSMPGLDGWTTLERIRELSDVPVIMLTARSEELEKTRGLRAGADDYVTKPFGRQELLARVEALLRRAGGREAAAAETYSDPFVSIDFAQRAVTAGDQPVDLTPLEFRLLTAFVRHPNQVLSHEQLLELVWGDLDASREQVKLYVGYLRKKLSPGAPDRAPIETRRGFGYTYRPGRR